MSHATVRRIAVALLLASYAALVYGLWLLFYMFWKDFLIFGVIVICLLLFFLQSFNFSSGVLEKIIIWIVKKDKKKKGKGKGKKTEHHKSGKKKDESSSPSHFSG